MISLLNWYMRIRHQKLHLSLPFFLQHLVNFISFIHEMVKNEAVLSHSELHDSLKERQRKHKTEPT